MWYNGLMVVRRPAEPGEEEDEEVDVGQTKQGPPRREERGPLTNRPMAGAFRGVRVGPECLECHGPLDTREGWSLQNPRGSRRSLTQGFLHDDCRKKCEAKRLEEERAKGGEGMPASMRVPAYSADEVSAVEFGEERATWG